MRAALMAMALLCVNEGARQDVWSSFVGEGEVDFSELSGLAELGSGPGWLRTPAVYLDFRLAFDFRAISPQSDAGVLVRTWVDGDEWPRRGYRIRLPGAPTKGAPALLEAKQRKVVVVQEQPAALQPSHAWQQVEITADGPRITIALNGAVVGVFDVESYGGHIMLDNRQGRVQFRNITIERTQRTYEFGEPPTDLLRAPAQQKRGLRPPKLVYEVSPAYTPEATQRRVEGIVVMEAVVMPDGSVGPVEVIRQLDPVLDLCAIAAARAWRFRPGLRDGKSVPVLVAIEMMFRLK
jgi:TonB family protein